MKGSFATAPAICQCCGRPIRTPGDAFALGAALNFSTLERRVFERLCRTFGAWVEPDTLFDALYGDDIDGGPLSNRYAVAGIVKGVRRKIRGGGLGIETILGSGGGARRLYWTNETNQRNAA